MEIVVESKYLVFPVNTKATVKTMYFKENGSKLFSLKIKLDNISPDYYAYINVSRFKGHTIDLSVSPKMDITFRCSEEMDLEGLYKEPLRPQIHFTTKNGWINDPNGLLYHDGVYHLFYQHNPADTSWNNMHWGHAESPDLIHWEEKDIALYPTSEGMPFSGSAIVDVDNRSGLGENGNPPALLFHTMTYSPKYYRQDLAYSCDGFKTIKTYEHNPVVPNIQFYNRDPKVVFCEELDAFLMFLYINDNEYHLLSSKNLINWKEFTKITIPEENECPDIFYLYNSKGEKRWILSGAHGNYIMGEIKDNSFVPTSPIRLLQYGTQYAGQSFSGLPDGRAVRILLESHYIDMPRFRGQMSIPMDMAITEIDGEEFLTTAPVKEIENIYDTQNKFENIAIGPEKSFTTELSDSPYLIKVTGHAKEDAIIKFNFFGRDAIADVQQNCVKIGKNTAPLSPCGKLDLTFIIDRDSVEIFSDAGRAVMVVSCDYTIMDRNLPVLKISSSSDCTIESLETISLKSIWEK